VCLHHHGFEIVGKQLLERTRTAALSFLFMQIPVATAWLEPPLEYESRLALLEEALLLAVPGQLPGSAGCICDPALNVHDASQI
jgi:hypothetical protein